MRPKFHLSLLAALALTLGGCAAQLESTQKAEGYTGTIRQVAVFIVDFGPGSETYATGSQSQRGTASASLEANEKMATAATQMMAELRKTLPGLMTDAGLNPSLTVIQKSDSKLQVDGPDTKAIVIRATRLAASCANHSCVARMTLTTEVFDPKLQKRVWTTVAKVGERTTFDHNITADHVREYWKVIYDQLRKDGLVA
jgi:hypothetical protein